MTQEEVRPRRRRPWLAALLSLSPGVGHLYAGSPWIAGAALLSEYAFVSALSWVLFRSIWGVTAFLVAIVSWRVLVGRSAMRYARDSRRSQWRPRTLVVATFSIVGFILNAELGTRLLEKTVLPHGSTFRIPSGSMAPVLVPGDYIMTRAAGAADLRRDQLVVYKALDDRSFVHRLVALPADTIEMRDGALSRNGALLPEPYAWRDPARAEVEIEALAAPGGARLPTTYNWGPVVVPPGHFVVLGDNRGNSIDSRYFGFIADSSVTHLPLFVYFSVAPDSGVRWNRVGQRLTP